MRKREGKAAVFLFFRITLSIGESNPARFSRAAGIQFCGKRLENIDDIPCGVFLDLNLCRSVEIAKHLSAKDFELILGADDAALLAQGKEDKPQSGQKIRREADRVRFPYAYPF